MNIRIRQLILRANAAFLLIAASFGIYTDLAGAFFATGPQHRILSAAPHAAIGFVEAHGLAFIIGVLLWLAEPARLWHLTAAAGSCVARRVQSRFLADIRRGGRLADGLCLDLAARGLHCTPTRCGERGERASLETSLSAACAHRRLERAHESPLRAGHESATGRACRRRRRGAHDDLLAAASHPHPAHARYACDLAAGDRGLHGGDLLLADLRRGASAMFRSSPETSSRSC